MQNLSGEFRVYTPDIHEYSGSTPSLQQGLELSRRLFLAFLEAEGLHKVSLVGQSMGAFIALDLALSHPERVEKLVLVDSAGLGTEVNIGLRLLTLPCWARSSATSSGLGSAGFSPADSI